MAKLTDVQNEVIKEALNRYSDYISIKRNKIKIDSFMEKLEEFNDNLIRYKSEEDIEDIIQFGVSADANSFTSAGMGMIAKPGYYEYLNRKDVREKLIKMIKAKNEVDDNKKYEKLLQCDIRQYLNKVTLNNNKPKLLVGRLVLMMFPELFTAVPYENKLNTICTKLQIPYNDNMTYLAKQRRVRELTDSYLRENNLYDIVTDNAKVSLAWWIL